MVYEKARELGNLILESDFAKTLNAAKDAYTQNHEAVLMLEEFTRYKALVQKEARAGNCSQEEMESHRKAITLMAGELEENQVIMNFVTAEDAFNGYVNKVMGLLRATITGNAGCGSGCGSGGCGSGCSA